MKIIITFELKNGEKFDIQVASQQKIEDTLQVLRQSIKEFEQSEERTVIREKNTGRIICASHTYEEEHIYSGGELMI